MSPQTFSSAITLESDSNPKSHMPKMKGQFHVLVSAFRMKEKGLQFLALLNKSYATQYFDTNNVMVYTYTTYIG